MVIPDSKRTIINDANTEVKNIMGQWNEGLITSGERYNKVVDRWAEVSERIADEMMEGISTQVFNSADGSKTKTGDSFNFGVHHGRLRRSWLDAADASARRDAWSDG